VGRHASNVENHCYLLNNCLRPLTFCTTIASPDCQTKITLNGFCRFKIIVNILKQELNLFFFHHFIDWNQCWIPMPSILSRIFALHCRCFHSLFFAIEQARNFCELNFVTRMKKLSFLFCEHIVQEASKVEPLFKTLTIVVRLFA
jgi:hypothetical protein